MKGIYKTINDLTKKISKDMFGVQYCADFSKKMAQCAIKCLPAKNVLRFNINFIKMNKDNNEIIEAFIKYGCNQAASIKDKLHIKTINTIEYKCQCGNIITMYEAENSIYFACCDKCKNKIITKGKNILTI